MKKINPKALVFCVFVIAANVMLAGCSGGEEALDANAVNIVPESQAPKPVSESAGGGGGVAAPADKPETGP